MEFNLSAALVVALCVAAACPGTKEPIVSKRATGTFEVKLVPQPIEGELLSRMTIEKQFHGDLEATSKGEMLAAGTTVQGSAGYVAVERVTGTLDGRTGTFALQHSGTLTRGTPALVVTVVPDSGTGELVGLSGKMNIVIEGKKHLYTFDYSLGGS